jgi:hypothetical protein
VPCVSQVDPKISHRVGFFKMWYRNSYGYRTATYNCGCCFYFKVSQNKHLHVTEMELITVHLYYKRIKSKVVSYQGLLFCTESRHLLNVSIRSKHKIFQNHCKAGSDLYPLSICPPDSHNFSGSDIQVLHNSALRDSELYRHYN